MDEKKRFCRKCLLSEVDPEGVYRSVAEYIASLDSSVRCDEEVYRERLRHCTACDQLTDGMCLFCGCYVEARAAKKKQNCPGIPHKW